MPDDISLTGFDKLDISGYAVIRLITVERNSIQIATEGSRMLLVYMEEGIRPDDIWLENRLIKRKTVRNRNSL